MCARRAAEQAVELLPCQQPCRSCLRFMCGAALLAHSPCAARPPPPPGQDTSPKLHSVADLVLEGHKEVAAFALGVSSAAPLAASGGRDAQVLGCAGLRCGNSIGDWARRAAALA